MYLIKDFIREELEALESGVPLARWSTIITLHRRYVEKGGQLTKPRFATDLEKQLPNGVSSVLGRYGRKVPYRLIGGEPEELSVKGFAAVHLKPVTPLGRGVPKGDTSERKQSDWCTVSKLHVIYLAYCKAKAIHPLGLIRFARELADVLGSPYPIYRFGASRLPCILAQPITESEPSNSELMITPTYEGSNNVEE